MASGIRVGTAAATTRGLDAEDFNMVGKLIAATVFANGDEVKLAEIKRGREGHYCQSIPCPRAVIKFAC